MSVSETVQTNGAAKFAQGAEASSRPEAVPSFLRQITRRRPSSDGEREERCELCGAALSEEHQHLLNKKDRQITCACDGCVILFCGQQGAHYLRIPRRIRRLADFHMTDLEWESLLVPINLAFFYRDASAGRVMAMYPSPAGATESLLTLSAWEALVADNPVLAQMQPDVEALLVNRTGGHRLYYLAPIDVCFELVGLMRRHWRGLSGGEEVWREIDRFFSEIEARARPAREVDHA
jgi:hypothetical protein